MPSVFLFCSALLWFSNHVLGAYIAPGVERRTNLNQTHGSDSGATVSQNDPRNEERNATIDDMLQVSLGVTEIDKLTFYLDGDTSLQDNVIILDEDGENEKNITLKDLIDTIDAQAPNERLQNIILLLQHTHDKCQSTLRQLQLTYQASTHNTSSSHLHPRSPGLLTRPNPKSDPTSDPIAGTSLVISQILTGVAMSIISGCLTFFVIAPLEAKAWEYLFHAEPGSTHNMPLSKLVFMGMVFRSLSITLSAVLRWAKQNEDSKTYGALALYILNHSFLQFAAQMSRIQEARYFLDDEVAESNLGQFSKAINLGPEIYVKQQLRKYRRQVQRGPVLKDLKQEGRTELEAMEEGRPAESISDVKESDSFGGVFSQPLLSRRADGLNV